MSVHEKLLQVQTSLKAPKGQYNSFGKYNYRSCEDILEAVKPHLKEAKATLHISDSLEMYGDWRYIKATAIFTDAETGETVENTAYAREPADKKGMDASQITGAASSYARKYALNGLFCIDDTKDADTDEYRNQTTTPKITCSGCGKEVKGMKRPDGTIASAAEVAKGCNGMCFACYKAKTNGDKP